MTAGGTIYILLPVHNRREVTRKFIGYLEAQTYADWKLVLIDDGSTDGTAKTAEGMLGEKVTVLRGDGGLWWAGALKLGCEWLYENATPAAMALMINDDTEFGTDFLARGAEALARGRRTLYAAGCYGLRTKKLLDAGVHADWHRLAFTPAAGPDEIDCASTRGLFLRVGDIYETGGFRPGLLPHYLSDYEFTMRAKRRGFALVAEPGLDVFIDEDVLGYTGEPAGPLCKRFKALFSQKAILNPACWSAFIALACPWRWKLINWLRVWKRAALALLCPARAEAKRRLDASR